MPAFRVDTFQAVDGHQCHAGVEDANTLNDAITAARLWVLCGAEGQRSAKIQDNRTGETFTCDGEALLPVTQPTERQLALF